MGEAEPWSGQKGESREGTSRAPQEQGKDSRGKSQGEEAEMLSNSRGSPVCSEVAAQPQEQLAFRSATAAVPTPASVNEAAAAAELRDSPRRAGPSPSLPWPRPLPGLECAVRPRPRRRGDEVE